MPRKPQKDRTSIVIAVVMHVVLIGGVGYWAYKTGKLEQIRQAVLQYVKGEKKEEKKAEPVQQRQTAPPKLPPINQGMKAPESSGTRRAVASDAPEAAGGTSFFQDTRKQVEGAAGGAAPKAAEKPVLRIELKPAAPPRAALAPPPKTTIKQLYLERAKEAASVEAVGSEQISKTASTDASAILTKISGASVVDGKFAVIRGLTDRYVSTTLNGADIPSADPYRRSASLDQFPAPIIDKVVVSKTFTPDLPGTSTGGGINIVTKAFPSQPFASLSFGAAYNSQATFNKNFLTYEGGKLDWLGMDDGTRALPDMLKDLNVDLPNQPVSANPRVAGSINPAIATANFIAGATREMGVTQFGPTKGAPPLDHNFSVAAGDTTHFLGKPVGVLATLNYRHEYRFQEDEVARRWKWDTGNPSLSSDYKDTVSTDTVNWSAMATLSLQLHPDHEVGASYLFNQNGQAIARLQDDGFSDSQPGAVFVQNRLQWVERNLQTLQFKGSDLFSELGDLRLDWIVAQTTTTQDEPDTRFFNYYQNGNTFVIGGNTLPPPADPTRYFRYLEENNLNPKVDLTLPFRSWDALTGELKVGWFLSTSERSFYERQIYYKTQGSSLGFDGNVNGFLTPDNLGYTLTTNAQGNVARFNWGRFVQNADSVYDAKNDVHAAYAMLDFLTSERIRLIGGARIESTALEVDSVSYIANSVTGSSVNSTRLKQTDVLPAAGLVFTLKSNMNLRLNYSQTIARPSIRELAAVRSYDPILDLEVDGNPTLTLSSIENYDLRWEWFPRPGEIISCTLFYKSLEKPIERNSRTADDKLITYLNRESGTSMGIELEARKYLDFISPLLADFSVGGNLTLIDSETELTASEYANKTSSLGSTSPTRPLYDTSPYLINADLSYDNARSGTSASLVFNVAGPRIAFASQSKEDVYEQPAPVLDFVLSQRIGRSMTVRFTVKNLLDPVIKRTYGEKESEFGFTDPVTFEPRSLPNLYSSSRRGVTFGVSLSYEF